MLVAMAGADYIHLAAGMLDSGNSISYEQFIIDNEILGMCRRVLGGIEVNDDTLALALLIEKGPGKDYLAEEHTVRHMRDEFFVPRLANRQKRESLQPDSDALSRAKAFVAELRGAAPVSQLSPSLRQQILNQFPEIRRPAEKT